jgi:hypothetical protein
MTGSGGANEAEQLTVVPPFNPAQFQLHGPEPVTADEVPTLHSAAPLGAMPSDRPLAVPQAPALLLLVPLPAPLPQPVMMNKVSVAVATRKNASLFFMSSSFYV